MPHDPLALRRSGPATSTRSATGSLPSRRRFAGWLPAAMGLGFLLLSCLGCTTVSNPVDTPSARLKAMVNPLGARAEKEAFEQKVQDDPFPAASASGF